MGSDEHKYELSDPTTSDVHAHDVSVVMRMLQSSLLNSDLHLELDDCTTTSRLGSKDHFLKLIALDFAFLDAFYEIVGLDGRDEVCSICLLDEGYGAPTPASPRQSTSQCTLFFALSNQSI